MQNEAARKAEEQFRATRERELRGSEESVAAASMRKPVASGERTEVPLYMLPQRNVLDGLQYSLAHFLGRLDARVSRIDHADEDALPEIQTTTGPGNLSRSRA
jgi:hypothetical protein